MYFISYIYKYINDAHLSKLFNLQYINRNCSTKFVLHLYFTENFLVHRAEGNRRDDEEIYTMNHNFDLTGDEVMI